MSQAGGPVTKRTINFDVEGGPSKAAKKTPPDNNRHPAPGPNPPASRSFITKIRMINFLAYEDVEVEPGEALNLVIGQNGCGKSTILDAICLVFNGDLSIIDRGKRAYDFIRRRADEGSVEITLRQPEGGSLTIKRKIYREGKDCEFFINGKIVHKKKLAEVVNANNIKIDNLCHFLPQEKVKGIADLAADPKGMLNVLEDAIGQEWMIKVHNELKDLQKNESNMQRTVDAQRNEIAMLKVKEQELANEIARFSQIAELEGKIDIRQKKMPWVLKSVKEEEYRAVKEDAKQAEAVFKEKEAKYKDKLGPCKAAQEALRHAKDSINENVHKSTKAANAVDKLKEGDLELQKQQEEKDEEIAGLVQKQKATEKQIREKEKNIEGWREDLKNAGPPPKDTDLKLQKVVQQIKVNADETRKAQQEQRQNKEETVQRGKELEMRGRLLNSFKDPKQMKLDGLRERFQPLYRAHKRLEELKDQFERPVYGPILLELEVDENQDGLALEAAIGKRINSFLVQTSKDFKRLHDLCEKDGELKTLREHIDILDSSQLRGTRPRGPDLSQFKDAGVLGYLIDRIRGPEAILHALCDTSQLHRVTMGTQAVFENRFINADNPAYVAEDQHSHKKFHKFATQIYTPHGVVSTQYSIYGQKNKRVEFNGYKFPVSRLKPGNNSGGQGKEELEREVARLQDVVSQARQKEADSNHRVKELLRRREELMGEQMSIKDDKNKVVLLTSRIKREEELIANLRKQNHLAQQPRLEKEKEKIVAQRVGQMLKTVDLARDAEQYRRKAILNELRSIGQKELLQRLEQELKVLAEEQVAANKRLEEVIKVVNKAKEARDEAKKKCGKPPTEAEKAQFNAISDDLDVLETEVQVMLDEKDKLGIAVDRTRLYEQTKAQIAELEDKVNNAQDSMAEYFDKIATLKRRWLDGEGHDGLGLRHVIEQIGVTYSAMFTELNCVGEISLDEAKVGDRDDFENYSLKIMVKFRENSNLCQLNGKIQSGGETSLSIMMFIISLQQLTEVPFRVIDEINQGMDTQYEKAMFDKIVEFSCRDRTSQIFLISPKLQGDLLNNLQDHVTVLMPTRGPWNLAQQDWRHYPSLASTKKRRRLDMQEVE